MRKFIALIVLALIAYAVAAVFIFHPDRALRVATGMVSHTLCSETFVVGLDTDQSFAETFRSMPGMRRIAPLLRYEVDRRRRSVTATLAGGFEKRRRRGVKPRTRQSSPFRAEKDLG